jgi:hypothetical protein
VWSTLREGVLENFRNLNFLEEIIKQPNLLFIVSEKLPKKNTCKGIGYFNMPFNNYPHMIMNL